MRVAESNDLMESPIEQQNVEMRARAPGQTPPTCIDPGDLRRRAVSGPPTRGMITRHYRDEPPDGSENLSEWKEGKYHVLERRTGPGEDIYSFSRSSLNRCFFNIFFFLG